MNNDFILAGVLCMLLTFLTASSSCGQSYIGVSSGFQVPGAQDQKFKKFGANGRLEETYLSGDVDGQVTTFNSIFYNRIFSSPRQNKVGIRLELTSWEFTSRADNFTTSDIPLTGAVKQDRLGVFGTFIKYYSLNSRNRIARDRISPLYYFVGVGGGFILTDNDPGRLIWSPGVHLINGLHFKITEKISGSLEGRYLLSKDADNYPSKPGWAVDTSGTPTFFRLHPHFDTRFLAFEIGLKYRLSHPLTTFSFK